MQKKVEMVGNYHYVFPMPRDIKLGEKIAALAKFFNEEGRVPTYAEIMGIFGYKSLSPVQNLLKRLSDEGLVKLGGKGRLSFTGRLTGGTRVLGLVSAGFPSPAEEETVDLLNLNDFLVRRKEATYILKVDGDSMIEEGIKPGDLLIVERGRNPKNGDIVVAAIDEEWTVKFFQKDGKNIRLVPANKKYAPIVPNANQSLILGGIVKAVIRKYGN